MSVSKVLYTPENVVNVKFRVILKAIIIRYNLPSYTTQGDTNELFYRHPILKEDRTAAILSTVSRK